MPVVVDVVELDALLNQKSCQPDRFARATLGKGQQFARQTPPSLVGNRLEGIKHTLTGDTVKLDMAARR